MQAYTIPVIASFLLPGLYLILSAHDRFWRAALSWLAWPVIVYCALIAWEMLTRETDANALNNALLGFSLISAILLIPWLIVSALVIGIAWGIRRYFRRPVSIGRAASPPVLIADPPDAPAPAKGVVGPRAWDKRFQVSPDGTIRVDFDPIEWYRDAWLSPPRVTDLVSGNTIVDLGGQDWDVTAEFPGPRQVILDGRRFGGAAVKAMLDIGRETYQILEVRNVEGQFPTAPLSEVAQGLEEVSHRSTLATRALVGHPPQIAQTRPGWIAAMLLLGGVLAIIALIAIVAKRAEESGPASAPTIAVPANGFRPAILG